MKKTANPPPRDPTAPHIFLPHRELVFFSVLSIFYYTFSIYCSPADHVGRRSVLLK